MHMDVYEENEGSRGASYIYIYFSFLYIYIYIHTYIYIYMWTGRVSGLFLLVEPCLIFSFEGSMTKRRI